MPSAHRAPGIFTLVVAAAAENNDYSKNDYPGAVIVEEMAKAVVIHKVCSSGCY